MFASDLPGLKQLPDTAPLGSFHVLKLGSEDCVGRFTEIGWVIYRTSNAVWSVDDARRAGYMHYRPILEGRRVLSEGRPLA